MGPGTPYTRGLTYLVVPPRGRRRVEPSRDRTGPPAPREPIRPPRPLRLDRHGVVGRVRTFFSPPLSRV